MIDLSTIVLIGVTLKPVHRPAMIYCGPKSQKDFVLVFARVIYENFILYNNINNTRVY
jgi:hypothetical protein